MNLQTQEQPIDAQLEAARDMGRREGEAKGRAERAARCGAEDKAELDRILGIVSCAEAKDHPRMALALALESDMNVEDAAKLLAKLAKEPPLAEGLRGFHRREISAGADEDGGIDTEDTEAIYAKLNAQTAALHDSDEDEE